jgi:hypothetical protein
MSSYLTTASAASTYYLQTNPDGFIGDAPSDGSTYGRNNGAWTVAGGGGSYLPLAGGALDANASITASDTSTATDSELAGWGLGVQLSADHTKGTTLEFDGLDAYDGASHMQVTPTGLTFPDASVQTTAFPGFAGYATESFVTSQGYITQGTADSLYYSISNPSGFITSGDLAGYATESFVTSQGYITASALTGYATESWVQSQGYLYPDANGVIQYPNGVMTDPSFPIGRFWYQSQKFRWTDGVAIRTVASESYVTTTLGSYAPLAGASFAGKVNAAASTSGSAGFNLGAGVAPVSPVAGDLWTASNTDTLRYRAPLTNQTFDLATRNATNTFNSPNIIDTTSNTLPALRVTQKGTSPSIVVEDSLNPDTTAFVVDASGNLGVGVDAATWTAVNKVEVVGNLKATAFVNGTGPTYNVKGIQTHSGGADTHELLVSVNGSTYRVGMKFVSTP